MKKGKLYAVLKFRNGSESCKEVPSNYIEVMAWKITLFMLFLMILFWILIEIML